MTINIIREAMTVDLFTDSLRFLSLLPLNSPVLI